MPSFSTKVLELLKQNSREKNGHLYTVPSPENYPYQWLWDSCFQATIWSYFDTNRAKAELFSLTSGQLKNGLLPHMIYWEKPRPFGTLLTDVDWGLNGTSTITQPPIIADAVLKIFQTDGDLEFVKKIYPSLKLFYTYLLIERDSRGNHLIGIINPDESGEDNSPRFDIPLKLPTIQTAQQSINRRLALVEENKLCQFGPECMKNFFWVKDVPFNCFTIKNLMSLAKLARLIQSHQDAAIFELQANQIKEAMRKYMYEDGLYWPVYQLDNSKDKVDYKKIKVLTWAIFAPLYAGIVSKVEAENLVDNYLLDTKKFWLHYPVPTVSASEASFDPEGFWRGPVWINVNWFIFKGLIDYGYLDIAQQIYKVSKFLVEKQGFREQYNPITGMGMGAKNFTWGTLVLDMEKSLKSG